MYNKHGLKDSINQYRNIGGVHFIHWTSDVSVFERERKAAKEKGLKSRVIKGELYLQVKK